LIGGQRLLTARASFSPSIEPGIWTSVKTTAMSRRPSRISIASSAFTRLEYFEACGGNHFDGLHSRQKLILDDQHHWPL
jgi:hypothetical protein